MSKFHILHGFNVDDGGKDTTDTLIPRFQNDGFKVKQHDYGYLWIFGVLFRNDNIAREVAKHIKPGDYGVGHSNGCAILVKAAQEGAPFEKLFLINPALENDVEFPAHIKEIHVFHNKYDKPVKAAKWLRRLLPWHRDFLWGEMGNTGYQGDDERVFNHDQITWGVKGHSTVFKHKKYIAAQFNAIKKALNAN